MRRERASLGRYWGGVLLFAAAFSPAFAGQVTGVALDQGATGTRAEIRLQGKGEYKTLSLHGPERLVVDLPASSAANGLRLPAGGGVVKSVRTGRPDADTLRIVFDLAEPVVALTPRMESAAGGATLVIEWPGDAPARQAGTVAATPATVSTPATGAPDPVAAAQATAALTSTVVQQARQVSSDAAAAAGPAALSPQEILNGGRTVAATAALQAQDKPQAGSPVPLGDYLAASKQAPANTSSPEPSSPAAAPSVAEAAPARVPEPAVPMRAGMRPLVIAIDAGHGGQDSGAIGPTGKYEKNVTLAIARELARQIDATPGMKAYLVRDGDYFIPLPQRAQKARAAKADLFVSIHADAAENRSARGSSVYVLSLKGASSQRARWLADKENASDLIGGRPLQKDTLSNVLLDLAQSGHMKASEDAAGHVLDGLGRVGNTHKTQLERANFAVLRTSDMPAMLVETAFISNQEEERQLTNPAFQRKLAGAVLDGVRTYFTRQPPPGTLFAMRAQAAESAAVGGAGGSP
ncbi:MAG: N-acetylmuramoyl-L-alanine amidase [Pseudoxanthomonas sp.]